ncbi:MAG: aspartate aminotransferase family protein [Flavobacteriales bacterium TMED288]|nr:aspartate aminotransferase family protein [Flavobacteriales bacterium]RPG53351.1 MAG: aspartate aminotransferase family protein [Flavobacteriales bacterium TMED288]|tara:strand:+ start:500 stop:1687 length:1188 start_codon:yes stop_codon:yes gene_type:complete
MSKSFFLNHIAQTNTNPLSIHVKSAKGSYIKDINGKKYLDLVAGVSACTLGHCHPKVTSAIKKQCDKYLHVMVYGEFIQDPQIYLAKSILSLLPSNFDNIYFVNSGVESIEASIKLAKRYTSRSEIISFKNSYYGSTSGALSIMGDDNFKKKYKPLISDCNQINYNDFTSISKISKKTAAVVIEPIQGASGFITPKDGYLNAIRNKCNETKTLLIFDEIQTGFGRTGNFFGFQSYNVIPDILCISKGMGGGMSIGAFCSSKKIMKSLSENPQLGHITTFGGHPIGCVAALATVKELMNSNIISQISEKEKIYREGLKHPLIKKIRGKGLMLAIELESEILCRKFVKMGLQRGIITFFFLLNNTSVRISPPLTISILEIKKSILIIKQILNDLNYN